MAETREIATRGTTVTIQELVILTGFAYNTIQKDIDSGCPIVERGLVGGRPTKINVYEWLNWKYARIRAEKRGNFSASSVSTGSIVGDAKQRAAEAIASKREIEVQKMRQEVFNIADLDTFIADELTNLRTSILSIEEEIRSEVGPESAKRVMNLIINHINDTVSSMENAEEVLSDA